MQLHISKDSCVSSSAFLPRFGRGTIARDERDRMPKSDRADLVVGCCLDLPSMDARLVNRSLFVAVVFGLLTAALNGCSYMGTLASQTHYSLRQMAAPEQRVYKHMLNRDSVFVFGKLERVPSKGCGTLAVVALSDRYRVAEVVDTNHTARSDSWYAVNLPPGKYLLQVVCDKNGDGWYERPEVIGGRALSINEGSVPDMVLGGFDIDVPRHQAATTGDFRVEVRTEPPRMESLFYPKGSLRSLDDPIFSPEMANLGMYEPAAFMEAAPMLFYATEEDAAYKVPVVFVHGIGGSPRDFEKIIDALDRKRFKPWLFYYPSGADLNQSGAMFYRIFLSGKVIPLGGTPVVVVAHSMGGLVVREAFNHYRGVPEENPVARLITIASPLGGHPGARSAVNAPVILPSWRDLNPDNEFIAQLHRKPLPDGVEYHLFFTYGNDRTVKFGANSDGVVPLASQLSQAAQKEAKAQHGFDDTHEGVLRNREAIKELTDLVSSVEPVLPPAILAVARKGGYAVELGSGYSPMEAFYIQNVGYLLAALASGEVAPAYPEQQRFVRVARGEVEPRGEWETGWVKFVRDCPKLQVSVQCPTRR